MFITEVSLFDWLEKFENIIVYFFIVHILLAVLFAFYSCFLIVFVTETSFFLFSFFGWGEGL